MPSPPERPKAPPGHGSTAQPLARAIDTHVPLAALLARVRESQARLDTIAATLPPGLPALLRAGPLDDKSWVLLADHASAAAKLRQCLPQVRSALAAAGWAEPPVVVKVRPRAQ